VALSQILDRAVLPYELLESNPIKPVGAPKQRKKEPRFLTGIEVERIRLVLTEEGDQESAVLISVLAYVGIRPQDALALTWGHLGEELSVFQKNVDGQIIPGAKRGLGYRRGVNLPDPVRADLEEWRLTNGGPSATDPIFASTDGGWWNADRYRNWRSRRFNSAVKKSGVGDLTPYALRHTCASLLAAAGWNHLEIARQLGHSPETSVKVYQHLINAGNGRRRSIDEWILDAREEVRTTAGEYQPSRDA
jgi:integrase